MSIVGAFDVHRRQLTFDYLDTVTGEVKRGRVLPADREHLREWLGRFAGCDAAQAVSHLAFAAPIADTIILSSMGRASNFIREAGPS